MRKTKIVCTIGPSSDNEETIKALIGAGMNAARLNFSHGTHEEHGKRITAVKKVRDELKKTVAIVLDTKGPEIRTGNFKEGKVELLEGQDFILTTRKVDGDSTICSVSYETLHQDVTEGDVILIDDGLVGLKVVTVVDKDIHCKVLNQGPVSNHKGVNVPNVKIQLPALTDKDISDIKFGIKQGIDIIAASFIRKATDVISMRNILEENDGNKILIISKIENREGVNNIDEIIKFSDGIMVARGDLGVEIPTEEVPIVQKMIIEKCNKAGKPVITATQMLDSMIRNPRPTRAEASDVANAIFDGTDAIMLSGETANGKYPLEAVNTMARIAETAESAVKYEAMHSKRRLQMGCSIPDAVSHATVTSAMELNTSAIIAATQTGNTASIISKYRPQCNIIAATPYARVARRLAITWGVYPIITSDTTDVDKLTEEAVERGLDIGFLNKGDLVILVTGVPVGYEGTTNMMRVYVVGDILAKGRGMGTSTYGNTCLVDTNNTDGIDKNFQDGDILVVKHLDERYMKYIGRIKGIIAEQGGLTTDIAVECISMGIPVIVGAVGAMNKIRPGSTVTMDTLHGIVYSGKANIV